MSRPAHRLASGGGLAAAFAFFSSGTVLRAAGGIAAEALVLRALGPAVWGEVALAFSLFAVAQLARLQLGSAVQTYLAQRLAAGDHGAARRLLLDAWALGAVSALAVAAGVWAAAPWLAAAYGRPGLTAMLRALALVAAALPALGPVDAPALLGLADWRGAFRQSAAEALALPLAALATVGLGLGPVGWVALSRLVPLAALPLAWARWRALLRDPRFRTAPLQPVPRRRLLGFAAPMTANLVLHHAAQQAPVLVAGGRLAAETLGLVGFALATAARLWQLAAGPEKAFLSRLATARAAEPVSQTRALDEAWRAMLALSVVLALPLAALSGLVAATLGGARFAAAALPLALAAAQLPPAAFAVLRFVLYAAERPWGTTGLLAAKLAVTVAAALLLPGALGPAGYALAPAMGWLHAGAACARAGTRASSLAPATRCRVHRQMALALVAVLALHAAATLLPQAVAGGLAAQAAAGAAVLLVALPLGLAAALGRARLAALVRRFVGGQA